MREERTATDVTITPADRVRKAPRRLVRGLLKRAIDLVSASLALAILALPMLVIATLVRLRLGRPVLYRSQRPGLGGRAFEILKFRTMSDARDPSGRLLPDADRLTTLGRWLRRWSLDELPELYNVVRGEMSLVGPRPLRMEYLERYSPRQARRHEVKPGITGWAQINGRNALGWSERLEMDVWYVENWSLSLDLQILGRTTAAVFDRRGISAPGHATMPEFRGDDPQ